MLRKVFFSYLGIFTFSISGIVLIVAICVFGYPFSSPSNRAAAQTQGNGQSERFWAENWLQFSFSPSLGHYDLELDATPFDLFVNTQIALMKSPMVLESVAKNPAIAQLPNVRTQVNPASWIASKLTVEGALSNTKRSEIFIVSFDSSSPHEAEMVVNAVVDAYLRYYRLLTSQQEQTMQKTLVNEKEICEKNIQLLQTSLDALIKINPPDAPADVDTANIITRLERENRTLESLNAQLLRLKIAQTAPSRVRLLHRTNTQSPDSR